jgi:hypothetical protein
MTTKTVLKTPVFFLRHSLLWTACVATLAASAARCRPSRTDSAQNVESAGGASAQSDAAMSRDASAMASDSPWNRLTDDDLRRMLREHAVSKLHEYAPALDVARLAEYAGNPQLAPELSGKAVDELIHLAQVELTGGRPEQAAQWIQLARARARNRNSAFVANTILAEAMRLRAGSDEALQERAIKDLFVAMPMVRFQAATVPYQLYQTRSQLDARLGTIHRSMVSPETASAALQTGGVLGSMLNGRAVYLRAIEAARHEFEARPARPPYRFSTVDLTVSRTAQPIDIAVWDTGTSTAVLRPSQSGTAGTSPMAAADAGATAPTAAPLMGVVSDPDPSQRELVYNPGEDTLTRYGGYLRGVMDLRAGLASTPAAQQVLALVRAITTPEQQEELDTRLDAVGEWAHGTHVGGIITAGIPQARVHVFRSAWAGEARVYHHRGPTDAELALEEANVSEIIAYINAHQVRVVNASLGFTIEYLEDELRHETATYHSEQEVHARALAVQARRRANWLRAFTSCPQTLFVVAAGNSNQDIVEYGEIPGSITEASNLLVVGAVDRFGDWALFTNSNPERVRVFDHGVEVESVIPNGQRIPLSGTSMASPNVANLASKLISLNRALTPQRVIEVIEQTGDPIAAPFNGRIANEERAVALASRGGQAPRVVPGRR